MLRDMMIGERPHPSFMHKHFWRTVHFPVIAPGTPIWSVRS
jgi:hypothetical protein